MKKYILIATLAITGVFMSNCNSDDNNDSMDYSKYEGTWKAGKVTYEFAGNVHGPYDFETLPGPDAVCEGDLLKFSENTVQLVESKKVNDCKPVVSEGVIQGKDILVLQGKDKQRKIESVNATEMVVSYEMKMGALDAPIKVTYNKQ